MEINKERLEAYIDNLPDDRKFSYIKSTECLISSFIKETSAFKLVSCNDDRWWHTLSFDENYSDIPKFAKDLIWNCIRDYRTRDASGGYSMIGKDLKSTWHKLNPENQEPVAAKEQAEK